MTNYLTPENMLAYNEHLKKIDEKVEEEIQKSFGIEIDELKKSQRQRKYLKYLVLPE
jgi:S-adenosylhomocysteine hydrolase